MIRSEYLPDNRRVSHGEKKLSIFTLCKCPQPRGLPNTNYSRLNETVGHGNYELFLLYEHLYIVHTLGHTLATYCGNNKVETT